MTVIYIYFQNDDYYSMVRGNKFMSENTCKHIVMNGGINFVASQKGDTPQVYCEPFLMKLFKKLCLSLQ